MVKKPERTQAEIISLMRMHAIDTILRAKDFIEATGKEATFANIVGVVTKVVVEEAQRYGGKE